jgi:hypothetical protein
MYVILCNIVILCDILILCDIVCDAILFIIIHNLISAGLQKFSTLSNYLSSKLSPSTNKMAGQSSSSSVFTAPPLNLKCNSAPVFLVDNAGDVSGAQLRENCMVWLFEDVHTKIRKSWCLSDCKGYRYIYHKAHQRTLKMHFICIHRGLFVFLIFGENTFI